MTFLKQNWVRWIALVPGSLIAGFLMTFPLHWILYLAFAHNGTLFGFIELPPRSDVPIEYAIYPSIIAITFILTGYRIAPKHKLKVINIFLISYIVVWAIGSAVAIKGSLGDVSVTFSTRTVLALFGAILGWYLAKHDYNKKLSS